MNGVCMRVTADSQFCGRHICCVSTSARLAIQASSQKPGCRPASAHHSERRFVIDPLIATLKLQSNITLFSNMVIGTLAVDG